LHALARIYALPVPEIIFSGCHGRGKMMDSGKKTGVEKNGPAGAKGDMLWVSTLGINLVLATLVGVAIGWYLDKWFHTSPVLTIVFFFIGTFAGFRQIYLAVRKLGDEDKNHEQR
jgi:ATP synthase protein I